MDLTWSTIDRDEMLSFVHGLCRNNIEVNGKGLELCLFHSFVYQLSCGGFRFVFMESPERLGVFDRDRNRN
jgi:hypothetical protein